MNKEDTMKPRYCVQWDAHSKHMSTILCSLMEHQSLVDLAICCGNNTIHAHKCILAANSPYFREQLEKNSTAEQVIINGIDFIIIKSIVEFMYCGETNILEENLKLTIAVAKFFQMRGLQVLESDHMDSTDNIHIPSPVFISKKPKYPTAYRPYNNNLLSPVPVNKSPVDPFIQRKMKRKYIRSEAERACAKEAAASRLALETLQKELSSASQVNAFVIEESCTETTVENFIPHNDEAYLENINELHGMQIVNYPDLNNLVSEDKPIISNPLIHYNIHNNVQDDQLPTVDKLKHMVENNNDYQIMFQTNDGKFLNVPEDVLENLKRSLHYQVLEENGSTNEYHIIESSGNKSYEITTQFVTDQSVKNVVTDEQAFINETVNLSVDNTSNDSVVKTPTTSNASPGVNHFEADSVFNKDSDPFEDSLKNDADKYFSQEPEVLNNIEITNSGSVVTDTPGITEEKKIIKPTNCKSSEMIEFVQNDYFITHDDFVPTTSEMVVENGETSKNNPLNFYNIGDSFFNLTNGNEKTISVEEGGAGDCKIPVEKFNAIPQQTLFEDSFLSFENSDAILSSVQFSPRRTRSAFKVSGNETAPQLDSKKILLKKKK